MFGRCLLLALDPEQHFARLAVASANEGDSAAATSTLNAPFDALPAPIHHSGFANRCVIGQRVGFCLQRRSLVDKKSVEIDFERTPSHLQDQRMERKDERPIDFGRSSRVQH